MEKNNIPEEVTITPVIRDLERLGNKLYLFFVSSIKALLSALLLFLQFCVKNIVFLSIAVILGLAIGYFSLLVLPRTYSSTMVLDLNVDAKSQLYNDINYFDALIEREKFEN